MYELHYIDRTTGAHEHVTVEGLEGLDRELGRILADPGLHFLYSRDCEPQPMLASINWW